jgi:hypothetical protein
MCSKEIEQIVLLGFVDIYCCTGMTTQEIQACFWRGMLHFLQA